MEGCSFLRVGTSVFELAGKCWITTVIFLWHIFQPHRMCSLNKNEPTLVCDAQLWPASVFPLMQLFLIVWYSRQRSIRRAMIGCIIVATVQIFRLLNSSVLKTCWAGFHFYASMKTPRAVSYCIQIVCKHTLNWSKRIRSFQNQIQGLPLF